MSRTERGWIDPTRLQTTTTTTTTTKITTTNQQSSEPWFDCVLPLLPNFIILKILRLSWDKHTMNGQYKYINGTTSKSQFMDRYKWPLTLGLVSKYIHSFIRTSLFTRIKINNTYYVHDNRNHQAEDTFINSLAQHLADPACLLHSITHLTTLSIVLWRINSKSLSLMEPFLQNITKLTLINRTSTEPIEPILESMTKLEYLTIKDWDGRNWLYNIPALQRLSFDECHNLFTDTTTSRLKTPLHTLKLPLHYKPYKEAVTLPYNFKSQLVSLRIPIQTIWTNDNLANNYTNLQKLHLSSYDYHDLPTAGVIRSSCVTHLACDLTPTNNYKQYSENEDKWWDLWFVNIIPYLPSLNTIQDYSHNYCTDQCTTLCGRLNSLLESKNNQNNNQNNQNNNQFGIKTIILHPKINTKHSLNKSNYQCRSYRLKTTENGKDITIKSIYKYRPQSEKASSVISNV